MTKRWVRKSVCSVRVFDLSRFLVVILEIQTSWCGSSELVYPVQFLLFSKGSTNWVSWVFIYHIYDLICDIFAVMTICSYEGLSLTCFMSAKCSLILTFRVRFVSPTY